MYALWSISRHLARGGEGGGVSKMVEADVDLKRLLSHGMLWIEPVHVGGREPSVGVGHVK